MYWHTELVECADATEWATRAEAGRCFNLKLITLGKNLNIMCETIALFFLRALVVTVYLRNPNGCLLQVRRGYLQTGVTRVSGYTLNYLGHLALWQGKPLPL